MGIYSTPVSDLIARLIYQTTSGQTPARLLDGWKFEAIPVASVEGLADLPAIRLYVPDISGTYRPTRLETGSISVRLIISTKRDDGLIALIEKVELVMDAISYDTAGLRSLALKGTLKPWSWNMGNNFVVDNSLNGQVSITLEPKVAEFGQRRI